MSRSNDIDDDILVKLKEDPEFCFYYLWGDVYIWSSLMEILEAIKNGYTRIVISSGHGVGKTWLLGRLVVWYCATHAPSKVISTAPTWTQVKELLWTEIRTAVNASLVPIGGKLDTLKWTISDDHFAIGISTREDVAQKDYGATKLQGFHSPNLMVVIDEAAGVKPEIWTAAESLATGEGNIIIAIGNPTIPSGPFYEKFSSPIWKKIYINALNHPNIIGGANIPGAVNKSWIEERRQEWGEESFLWKAKVLGQFPEQGSDSLFNISDLEVCKHIVPTYNDRSVLGVDVARYGEDETVIYKLQGNEFKNKFVKNKTSVPDIVNEIIKLIIQERDIKSVGIDDTGVGGGVTDLLRVKLNEMREIYRDNHSMRILFDVHVFGIINGSTPRNSDIYMNLKSEIFYEFHKEIKSHKFKLDNDDEKAISQLAALKYNVTSNGKIRTESKDDMKKRGHKSPDRADAMMNAYFAYINTRVNSNDIVSKDPLARNLTAGLRTKNF